MNQLPDKLVFIDVETSGGSFTNSRIIEIGIIKVEAGKVVERFKSLINPEIAIPSEITLLTGINQYEVDAAPTFSELAEQIYELVDGCVLVAHNARFDYSFLKVEFRRLGYEFSAKQLCTVKLTRKLFPGEAHYNLDRLINRFQLSCPNRHRAYDDADCLWQLYQIFLKRISQEDLIDAIGKQLKHPTVPTKLKYEDLEKLPEGAGVYIFYGNDNNVLYIGKSKNLRDRIMSHFSDQKRAVEISISQQVERIETIETAGELGALLKESRLIKQLKPTYNRRLRVKKEMVIIRSLTNDQGYNIVKIERIAKVFPEELGQILGVFKSIRSAKQKLVEIAKEQQLCEKLLELDTSRGECFAARLGRCKGACIGIESPMMYNLRFIIGFGGAYFRAWPFENPIVIEERDHFSERVNRFVVDNWCLVGEQDDNGVISGDQLEFDVDTYQILRGYLKNTKSYRQISRLNLASQDLVKTIDD